MKRFFYLLIIGVILIIFQCTVERDKFSLEIRINGLEGKSKWIVTEPIPAQGNATIDTLDFVDGFSNMSGNIEHPKLIKLSSSDYKGTFVFMLSPGIQKLEAELEDINKKGNDFNFEIVPFNFSGSNANEDLVKFWNDSMAKSYLKTKEDFSYWEKRAFKQSFGLEQERYYDLVYSNDPDDHEIVREIMSKIPQETIERYKEEYNKILDNISLQRTGIAKNYIQENPKSYVGLYYFFQYVFLTSEEKFDYELMDRYLDAFGSNLKSTEVFKSMKQSNTYLRNMEIGELSPDFQVETPEGGSLKLSSLKGKVVLIDFWASWCKYCRLETPNLKIQYDKYKDKGFEVLSVSFDKDRNRWHKAMEEDQMPWLQVRDSIGLQDSKIADEYVISGIPYLMLIDEEGKIIAKNLRGPEYALDESKNLNKVLEDLFGF